MVLQQKRKLLFILLLCAATTLLLTSVSCLTHQSDKQILTVGVVKNFPPLYQLDNQGEPAGLAIDVIKSLSSSLNYEPRFVIFDAWPDVEHALKEKTIDIVPDMGITDSRKKWLSFSRPSSTFSISLFCLRGNKDIQSLNDFKDKSIGIVNCMLGDAIVSKYDVGRKTIYPHISDALVALLSGAIDGLVSPLPPLARLAHDAHVENQIQTVGASLFDVKRGIAVLKNNDALLKEFDQAQSEFLKSEEYKKLHSIWAGYERPYWTSKRILILIGTLTGIVIVLMGGWRYRSIRTLNKKLQLAKDSLELKVKERTQELAAKEQRYHAVVNNQKDILLLHMLLAEGFSNFCEVNDAAVDFYGYSREELLTMKPNDIVCPIVLRGHLESGFRNTMLSQGEYVAESVHIKKSGERVPMEVSATIVDLDGDKYILSNVRDIRDRIQKNKEIKESETFLRCMFDSFQDGISVLDRDLNVIKVNKRVEELYSDQMPIVGKKCYQVYHKRNSVCPFCPSMEAIETGGAQLTEVPYPDMDNPQGWLELASYPLFNDDGETFGVIEYVKEITQRKKDEAEHAALEEQLRQKHKMEAVGYMAGGIAHNFNNNLAIILGNVELSLLKQPQNSEVTPLLENAKTAIRNSKDLILKIITYSRKGSHNKVLTSLPPIIDETVSLLCSTLPVTVNLQQVFSPDGSLAIVNLDPSQLQEILVNLCNNAVQAMDENGDLKISLELVELGEKDIPPQYEAPPGSYAKLSVQDTGCGMPAEMVDRIFDPFYTTKEDYEGAGMGLATVQGIVAQHGGLIKVNSIPNRGTLFDIYFPIIKASVIEPLPMNTDMPKGTEKILFVDDDEQLVSIGKNLLSDSGYQITAMTESTEALKLFTANPDHFDLIITDQTMPHLTGKDLIQELKKIRPDIPTILCTGYSSKINEEEAKEQGIDAFFIKPLYFPELLQTMRMILDGKKE